MSRHVQFRPQAEHEVLEVRAWYDGRQEGLGHELGEAVDQLITRITDNPFAFPVTYDTTRRATLRRFPYAIYFRLLDDDILVLAGHGRQHERRWQSRS